MSHFTQIHERAAPLTSFSITQSALGSPLHFEPALGSKDLDDLINSYLPGSASPRQKRARVVLEFLNSIDALSYEHPVCLHYYLPQNMASRTLSRQSIPASSTASSVAQRVLTENSAKIDTLNISKSSSSLKRTRQEPTESSASSAKRMPGFSIMTRDGIDITEYASRGPKTKEQRDHAALMRKLKACGPCKRSKQKCDPSHHRPMPSSSQSPSTASPSNESMPDSLTSPVVGSQGSISPLSSFGAPFSQSPNRGFLTNDFAYTGQSFSTMRTPNPITSPSDFAVPESFFADLALPALPMQEFDPEPFQLSDAEVDAWNTAFADLHQESYNVDPWNAQNVFWPGSRSTGLSPVPSASTEQSSSGDSVVIDESEFDIGQWVHSSAELEDVTLHRTRRRPLSSQRREEVARARKYGVCLECCSRKIRCTHSLSELDAPTEFSSIANLSSRPNYPISESSLESLPHQAAPNGLSYHDQDYILYPDAPHFDLGLEPDQISRDIAATGWPPYTGYQARSSQTGETGALSSQRGSINTPSSGANSAVSDYFDRRPQPTVALQRPQAVSTIQASFLQRSHNVDDASSGGDGESLKDAGVLNRDCLDGGALGTVQRMNFVLAAGNSLSEAVHSTINQIPSFAQQLPNHKLIALLGTGSLVSNLHSQSAQEDLASRSILEIPTIIQTEPVLRDSQTYEPRHDYNHIADPDNDQQLKGNTVHNSQIIQQDHLDSVQSANSSVIQSKDNLARALQEGLNGVGAESSIDSTAQTLPAHDGMHMASMSNSRRQSFSDTLSADNAETLGARSPKVVIGGHGQDGKTFVQCGDGPAETYHGAQLSSKLALLTWDRKIIKLGRITMVIKMCILMTISILTTVSLLMADGDFPTGSISEGYLDSVVSLCCNLPESNPLRMDSPLEPMILEKILHSNGGRQSFPGLEYTVSACQRDNIDFNFNSFPSLQENDVYLIGIESGSHLHDSELKYVDVDGHWMEPNSRSKGLPRASSTPTAAMASSTTKPMISSTMKPTATDVTRLRSEALATSKRLTVVLNRLKRALSRYCTLSNIALTIPGLKTG